MLRPFSAKWFFPDLLTPISGFDSQLCVNPSIADKRYRMLEAVMEALIGEADNDELDIDDFAEVIIN